MGLLSGIDTFTGWTLLQKNGAAIEKAYAAGSSSASDIAYFQSVAPKLTSATALLGNYRALSFVATAYGLGSEVNQTAILKKLMTQDPTASSSLAQQLSDNSYRTFANATYGWSGSASEISAAVAGYQQNSYDTSVGQDNSSLQAAMYFSQNAKGMTLLSQLMSDKALLSVVTTALGIPQTAYANLSYNQQVAMLTPRVDMKQFSTAAGVGAFVQKYLAMDELNQIKAGTANSDPLTALFKSLGNSDNNNGRNGISSGITLSASMVSSGSTVNLFA